MVGIYKITNTINGKCYIGQSVNIERRWNEHRSSSRLGSSSPLLYKAIRKYGLSKFIFEIVEECSIDLLDNRETYWISKLNPEYNMTIGGVGTKGHIVSNETKQVLSNRSKQQWENMSEEEKVLRIKNNLKGPRIGRKLSDETKLKLRNANLGKKYCDKTRKLHSLSAKKHMLGNSNGNKSVVALLDDGVFAIEFPSIVTAANFFEVHPSCITKCLKGIQKHAAGCKWFYGSVETNHDECSGVGMILSHVEVHSIRKDEEIVHAQEMANLGISDKGIVQLAIRSGQFQTINVTDVREGELKSRNRMTGEVDFEWVEDDAIRAKLPIIGYIGYFKLLSGYSKTTYWSVEDLKQHGVKYSKTYKFGKGVWNDNFDAMARKTVLKLMLNKGDAPMSVEMQEAIKYDQSVILDEQGTHRYVDNEKPTDQEKLDAILEAEKKIEDAEVIDVEYSASGEIAFDK